MILTPLTKTTAFYSIKQQHLWSNKSFLCAHIFFSLLLWLIKLSKLFHPFNCCLIVIFQCYFWSLFFLCNFNQIFTRQLCNGDQIWSEKRHYLCDRAHNQHLPLQWKKRDENWQRFVRQANTMLEFLTTIT